MKNIITLIALFSFLIVNGQNWLPLGSDIDGYGRSGYSVSVNSAGDRLVIGAPYEDSGPRDFVGLARVYDFDGSNWVLQNVINSYGSDYDYFGSSVSLNSMGNRVIIGAPQSHYSHSYSGLAYVFDFDGNNWNEITYTWALSGLQDDWDFGTSTAVNALGDIWAVGAPGADNEAGRVYVYKLDTSNFNQLTAAIIGENSDDLSGTSIALNAVGDRIAIGAKENDGNGPNSGHVRIYEYRYVSYAEFLNANTTNLVQNAGDPPILIGGDNGWNTDPNHMYWIQLGADIDGEAGSDQSGASVSMNAAGDRVAIGALKNVGNGSNSGHVRIYEWDGTAWLQLGIDLDGEAAIDKSGNSVSMNAAGDRIAIGAYQNDGNGTDAGHVRVYEWDGTAWLQLGIDLDGEAANDESGNSVSMNAVGDRVAIGAPYNDDNGGIGHVRIYGFGQSNGCVVNTHVTNNSPILSAMDYSYASYQWLDCNNNYGILVGENDYQLNASSNGSYAVEITYNNGCVDTSSCYIVGNIADTCSYTDSIIVTTQIFDTTDVFDTTNVDVYDTTYIQVYDTLTTQVYDTTDVFDTSYVSISVTDTLYIDILVTGVNNVSNTIKVYPNPANDYVIIDNGNYSAMSSYTLKILNGLAQEVFNSQILVPQFQIPVSLLGSVGTYYIQILDGSNNLLETKQLILH